MTGAPMEGPMIYKCGGGAVNFVFGDTKLDVHLATYRRSPSRDGAHDSREVVFVSFIPLILFLRPVRLRRVATMTTMPAMSTIKNITSLEEWEAHLGALSPTTLLIIYFHAPWAPPCAQMATVLETLAAEYPVDDPPATSWVALDAEDLSDVSEMYDVTAVPFVVLSRGGKVLESVSGSNAQGVRNAVEKHAGGTSSSSTAPVGATAESTTTAPANGDATATTGAPSQDPEKQKEELFKRLENLVKAAPVMLFMKGTPSSPQCGFSRQIVAILRENSVKYGFFNILADDEVRQGLKEFADWPTFPQLWVDGELVGGLDIVKEEIANDADFFKAYSATAPGDAAVEP
ncbi:monothiol glutaredoxin-5 [Magnaporthiopsis poae ATCC 64411]|uniref:Monothiol glutaredoxin-5 n=1 Tax=Magnaporthiopsis poae (strain ATCC 64411 / 73-15) TaxID=644358 RepID=A0A0C4E6Y6_MAGP6|nr:monothiol glutaredoxin-5 [Magnaporthiopsis poae ATCC 64411]